jgi:hypothetical protein
MNLPYKNPAINELCRLANYIVEKKIAVDIEVRSKAFKTCKDQSQSTKEQKNCVVMSKNNGKPHKPSR